MFSFSGCEQQFPIYKVPNDIPFDSADKYYNVTRIVILALSGVQFSLLEK